MPTPSVVVLLGAGGVQEEKSLIFRWKIDFFLDHDK